LAPPGDLVDLGALVGGELVLPGALTDRKRSQTIEPVGIEKFFEADSYGQCNIR
jgi:hypothetical protein